MPGANSGLASVDPGNYTACSHTVMILGASLNVCCQARKHTISCVGQSPGRLIITVLSTVVVNVHGRVCCDCAALVLRAVCCATPHDPE